MAITTTRERRARITIPRATGGKPLKERPMWVPESPWQRIADKAYELYEQRGRRDGYALDDWLEAEHIVNQELYETH
jgi:hypothetical protein